ncbi:MULTISPECIES: bifunctional DNA primase/polymerase [Methylobacteriaceae]|uniref:bifunctional DNA primase/polymerase n=1 Tax=Methylobacterium sp. B4 TaxID=1938755 RepID=UPI0011B49637|nr:bifunctional DNA primase/polymerase [Methylobacterium sp. B4]
MSPLLAAVMARFQGASVVSVRDAAAVDHAAEAAERAARQAAADAAAEVRAREFAWQQEEHRQSFRSVAPACVANGWSLFPQARRGRRGPILVLQANNSRKTLQWGPYQERLPTPDELTWWANSERRDNRANTALIMGPISGGALAVDIDVSNPAISDVVLRLADQHLGRTEFRRVGRAPRIVLIYRSDPADPVRNKSFALDAKDAEGADQAIEVLADRKPITAFGAHHKTGRHFEWVGACRPDTHGPEHAPVVTQAAIEAFVSAIDAAGVIVPNLRRALAVGDGPMIDPALVTASGFVRPGVNMSMSGVVWDAQGKVSGGREAYVHSRAYSYVLHNAGLALTEDGPYTLAGLLKDECEAAFAPGGTKFKSPQELVRGCRERIDSSVAKLKRGEMKSRGIVRDEATGKVTAVPVVPHAVERLEADDLSWLPTERAKLPDDVVLEPADPALARERALISKAERDEQSLRLGTSIVEVFRKFHDIVRRDHALGKEAPVRPVFLLRTPTGAGKSSTAVRVTTEDLAKNGPILGAGSVGEGEQRRPARGAMLYMQPSYDNIAENVERFQRSSRGATAVFRRNAEAAAKDLPAGTRYLILEGKERGGCLRADDQRVLRAAGISTANLCKAQVEDGVGGTEERVCSHYDTCPVIAARKLITEAEVIFVPTAFLTSPSLPAGLLDHVAGVIIDERCWTEIFRWDIFPTATLDQHRAPPRTYKRDKGETGEDLAVARQYAARTAAEAIRKHRDVAAMLVVEHGMEKAEAFVEAAVKVCGRAQEAGRKLHPGMNSEAIKLLAERPKGKHLREEWRFWKIVEERLAALKHDGVIRDLNGGRDRLDRDGNAMPGQARGERDYRIQTLDGGANVRISWRAEPNFAEKPILLLDASADEELTSKCWGGRDVQVTHLDAELNLRTVLVADRAWRSAEFQMAYAGADKSKRRAIAATVKRFRHAISAASLLYGHGRILVGAPKATRAALMDAWGEPANCDWAHYGAIRGLDFARRHLVAFSVGRHEFPVRVIDGIVAAATYDDPEPETPIDPWGDGCVHNEDGSLATDDRGYAIEVRPPQVRRTHPLRNGGSVTVTVSEYEGRWARTIQRQFREEELAQFAGRLRPVYRVDEEAPLWIAGSKVLPEGFVVDDVVGMADLADPARVGALFDAIRRTGVADARVIAERAPDSRLRGAAAAVLHELGLDAPDATSRWSKGMAAVEAVVDGVSTTVQVPAYVGDPVAHVRETYAAFGMDVTETEFLALGAQPAGGYARSEEGDKVVAEVGTRAARAAREISVREEVRASFDRVASNFRTDAATLFGPHGIDMDEQMVLVANPPPPADDGAEVIPLPVGTGSGPAVQSEPDAAAA